MKFEDCGLYSITDPWIFDNLISDYVPVYIFLTQPRVRSTNLWSKTVVIGAGATPHFLNESCNDSDTRKKSNLGPV
jgi:hypothetical protein